jgi:hypothetical protein
MSQEKGKKDREASEPSGVLLLEDLEIRKIGE